MSNAAAEAFLLWWEAVNNHLVAAGLPQMRFFDARGYRDGGYSAREAADLHARVLQGG